MNKYIVNHNKGIVGPQPIKASKIKIKKNVVKFLRNKKVIASYSLKEFNFVKLKK
jgi:hypothetical protein